MLHDRIVAARQDQPVATAHELGGVLDERRQQNRRAAGGDGEVYSHHHQALADAGTLRVVATAPDGVIEAVQAPDRPFYLGVQWHAERTEDPGLGLELIRNLVRACEEGFRI